MIVKCTTCKNELERLPHQIKASKTGNFFCNRECRSKWDSEKHYNNRPEKECKQCGEIFKDNSYNIKRRTFCSQECSNMNRHINGTKKIQCYECHKELIRKNAMISEINFCGMDCMNLWNSRKSNKVLVTCTVCDKEHYVKYVQSKTYKTCSKECHNTLLREIGKTEEYRATMRKRGLKGILSQSLSGTKPERLTESHLNNLGIEFESQKEMYGKFIVDFFLPETNTVLEVFGDYWHANPEVYTNEESLSDRQVKQIKRDRARKAYLEKCGHTFVTVWEKDIYQDIEKALKIIE